VGGWRRVFAVLAGAFAIAGCTESNDTGVGRPCAADCECLDVISIGHSCCFDGHCAEQCGAPSSGICGDGGDCPCVGGTCDERGCCLVDDGASIDSGGGPACRPPLDEWCDPWLQTACGTNKCTFILFSLEPLLGHIGCAPQGSIPIGAPCDTPTETGTTDDCVGGALCYEGTCHAFCSISDPDSCGATAQCLQTVDSRLLELCFDRHPSGVP